MTGIALSMVIPVYNEQDVLPILVARLRPILDGLDATYEVVAVDDGSRDATPILLQRFHREWPELRVVRLRANAGHQAAISAGLAVMRGDFAITMDADLQDPPEVIPEMLAIARREHVDVVYGVRSDRSSDSMFKRSSAQAYYKLIRRVSGTAAHASAGDFRLMSRATVEAVNSLPERHRVLRLVVPTLAFPSATVEYRRQPRAAGTPKYSLRHMVRLSMDSLTGFSIGPLRVATWLGLMGFVIAVGILCYTIVGAIMGGTVNGWASTLGAIAAVGAIQLLCLGLLGEYVGRMYLMLQGRPTYFIAADTLTSAESGAPPPEADILTVEPRVRSVRA